MTSRTDWWKDFFRGLIVDFWREAMTPEATSAEADFLEKRLELAPGARVLDVPCGDGRLSIELARRGHRMTGVDISPDFLEAARESAERKDLSISWRQSDMRDLPWQEEFDAAFCGGSSFGFLGDDGDAAFLTSVCRVLKTDARFAIDAVKAAEVILPEFRERNELERAGFHFLGENRYDHQSGWVDTLYTVTRQGRSESRQASYRVYTYREAAQMLEAAGFANCEGFGSLDGEPFRLGSQRLLLLARKRA